MGYKLNGIPLGITGTLKPAGKATECQESKSKEEKCRKRNVAIYAKRLENHQDMYTGEKLPENEDTSK